MLERPCVGIHKKTSPMSLSMSHQQCPNVFFCLTWFLVFEMDMEVTVQLFFCWWGVASTKQQLYGHQLPITKTIKVRRTRHAGHRWRSRDLLISDVLWTPSYGQARAGRPARTYIEQLCEDTGCSPEELPEAMNNREEWLERVRNIRAGGTTRWWWLLLKIIGTQSNSFKNSNRMLLIYELPFPVQVHLSVTAMKMWFHMSRALKLAFP